jgi:hypothetical protein
MPATTTPLTAARSLLTAATMLDVILVVLYVATRAHAGTPWVFSRQFDLDAEATLVTFYASAKWMACGGAVALGLLAADARRRPREFSLRAVLAVFFLLLACDEIAQVHEWSGVLLDRFVVDRRQTLFPVTHLWMLLPAAGCLAFAVWSARALHRRTPVGATLLLWGLGLLVAGGGGVELLANFTGGAAWLQILQVACEETLENIGASCVLAGMIRFNGDVGVRVVVADVRA